jgi:hypothetical protein
MVVAIAITTNKTKQKNESARESALYVLFTVIIIVIIKQNDDKYQTTAIIDSSSYASYISALYRQNNIHYLFNTRRICP